MRCRVHGFAGARAKFSDPKAKQAYEEVYGTLIPKFFEGVFAGQ